MKLVSCAEVMNLDERMEWQRKSVTAYWDTGASLTSISKRLAERLGARLVQSKGVDGIGSWQETWATRVNLKLAEDFVLPFEEVEVVDYQGKLRPDLLIGMDIISRGRLVIDSAQGETVLTFEMA